MEEFMAEIIAHMIIRDQNHNVRAAAIIRSVPRLQLAILAGTE
jgi:hypothetical protein